MANASMVRNAKLAALLRYRPQREGLAQQIREAQEMYKGTVAGSESAGRLTTAAIQKAQPAVQGIYDRAAATSSTARAGLAQTLAALPAAGGYGAAAGAEAAAGQEKLARERASTEGSLQQQQVAAAQAPQFARTLAGQQRAKSLSKIISALSGVDASEGDAIATELGQREEAAHKEAGTERRSVRSDRTSKAGQRQSAAQHVADQRQKASEHAEDLQYRREHPSSRGGAGGVYKPLSKDKQLAGASELGRARELAAAGLAEGHSPSAIAKELAEGIPSFKTKAGNTTAAVKPITNRDLLEAGVEWAQYGAINRRRLTRLHKVGYSINALGVPVRKPSAASGVTGAAKAGR